LGFGWGPTGTTTTTTKTKNKNKRNFSNGNFVSATSAGSTRKSEASAVVPRIDCHV
jgi:hypothetical protein